MEFSPLSAISPIDGRYHRITSQLSSYFSEHGLIRYRVRVEVEYLIYLIELNPQQKIKPIESEQKQLLREIYQDFRIEDSLRIKEIEKTTNHDVKAVEYFLKERLSELNMMSWTEWVHFGLTSQDINNTAIPLSLKEGLYTCILKPLQELLSLMREKAKQWEDVPMLARTHGQPASPTKMGKEWRVFIQRIENQMHLLKTLPIPAKFGGATGNFNAHAVAFPEIDWHAHGKIFVEDKLGLNRSWPTTQIDHYDGLGAWFDNLKRINTILLDFCQDIWLYISMEYFLQKVKVGEVGSSAMPHKINPIDFENAEGNLGIANTLFEFFSRKLPISRLQRDLTDSTVLRNLGVPLGHMLISIQSILKGIDKLILNEESILQDLEKHFIVLSEAIQTILRREGFEKPYETLKDFTRTHKKPDFKAFQEFLSQLPIQETLRQELLALTPSGYTGQ